jgi:hypothetical protein
MPVFLADRKWSGRPESAISLVNDCLNQSPNRVEFLWLRSSYEYLDVDFGRLPLVRCEWRDLALRRYLSGSEIATFQRTDVGWGTPLIR